MRKKKLKGVGADDTKYRELRAAFKKKAKSEYEIYNQQLEQNLARNPRDFWNYINQRKGKKEVGGASEIKKYEGQEYKTAQEISNGFADYFSSVYVNDKAPLNAREALASGREIRLHSISEAQVSSAIKNLKPKRSLGPDRIPAYIYTRVVGNM